MPEIVSISYYREQPRIDVRWSKPRWNGAFAFYEVNYTSNGLEVDGGWGPSDNMISKPLGPGYYFVELCAITNANDEGKGGGRGPTNRVGPVSIPPVPSNVPLTSTQVELGAIRLQWDFSRTKTACGIYSNTIYYTHGDHRHKDVLIPASDHYILTNLAPGIDYTVRVSADCVGSVAAVTEQIHTVPQQYRT
ncbi:hypothetical protein AAHC03_022978 [Spirometra sp. Aus1]